MNSLQWQQPDVSLYSGHQWVLTPLGHADSGYCEFPTVVEDLKYFQMTLFEELGEIYKGLWAIPPVDDTFLQPVKQSINQLINYVWDRRREGCGLDYS